MSIIKKVKLADGNIYDVKDANAVHTSDKGVAGGVAELDATGKVPTAQLPSFVDDVVEGYYYNNKFYEDSAHTKEITPETGKIYVDLATNKTYRWGGTQYVEISPSLALGETSSTAYRGDRGKIAYDHSQDGTVHVTTAQKSTWDAKQNTSDNTLATTSKTIVGAINELDSDKLDNTVYIYLNETSGTVTQEQFNIMADPTKNVIVVWNYNHLQRIQLNTDRGAGKRYVRFSINRTKNIGLGCLVVFFCDENGLTYNIVENLPRIIATVGTGLSMPNVQTQLDLDLPNIDLSKCNNTTSGFINSSYHDSTKVNTSTTVNGHALSSNVTVTKADVSLGNVDNTSDANKPVSTAQQTALDLKQNITDNSLTTTAKTIVGAINEIKVSIPNPPAEDGSYILQCVVTNGVPTYAWVDNSWNTNPMTASQAAAAGFTITDIGG